MKILYSLFIIGSIVAASFNTQAQCTPDPTCMDVLNPGEICPEILPDGTVGIPYSQVVTIIPPATGSVGGSTINIVKIKIKSVGNIPPGLTYVTNPANGEFAVTTPYTRYCTLISGTPTTAGTYPLIITVTPYISVFGAPVAVTDQVDDTSLAITIHPGGTGYSIINQNKFSVLDSKPNPFSYSSKIGFISPSSGEVKLSVFDVVGNLIYKESMVAVRGENYFDFDGIKLCKGMYIYSISNGKDSFTKQLIKN
ncbi:MAG: T9SS type A sorting domain-containing protein [Bacteroidia bacterium]|nr:T9SS type A sorting domain-containing protein [Bacteroidia bacterium]